MAILLNPLIQFEKIKNKNRSQRNANVTDVM